MNVIYWFRQDLRLHDQALLSQLCESADTLLPVYCLNPDLFRRLSLGFAKTGPWRTRFLLESLKALQTQLRQLGSDLYVYLGHPQQIIPALARQIQADAVYGLGAFLPEEKAEADALQRTLAEGGLPFLLHPSEGLLPLENLPFDLKDLPKNFTAFRKLIEPDLQVPPPLPPPQHLPQLPELSPDCPALPSMQDLFQDPPQDDPRAVLRFGGGERAALARLDDYIWQRGLIRTYKETRNGLLGEAYSSKFSPWLANGALSARQIYRQVRKYENQCGANDSTYWLIFELLWREYFRLVALQAGKQIFLSGGLRGKVPPAKVDQTLFAAWCRGQTGQSFIDANLRELALSGWMSNRGRQNVASYLIHDLNLPWTWGAAWFEHCLIDYDPCSNWGNWMYLAGVGNDPRPMRRFNPEGQAQRYDPEGQFQAHWLDPNTRSAGFHAHNLDPDNTHSR